LVVFYCFPIGGTTTQIPLIQGVVMSRSIYVLVVVILHLLTNVTSASEPQFSSAEAESSQSPALIHEELPDETSKQLGMARQSLLVVDLGAAAKQLRKAAANLRNTSTQADDATKPRLNDSADELDSLAHRVENGTVKSAHELDQPSARALQRLSRHHYLMAQRSWLHKQRERTGKQLRSAADNLEHAAMLSGKEVQVATQTVVKDVRLISAKLVEGVGYGVDEVGKGFESLGKQVESVGNGMEPTQKTVLRSK
jgi:hypothetical protein